MVRDSGKKGSDVSVAGNRPGIGFCHPDNRGYYAMVLGDDRDPPVLTVDAAWAETLLGLLDDVPYATGP